jgi:hypothetical protein
MRPISVTTVGVQSSPAIPVDWRIAPFQITLDTVVSAPATYDVQWTDDDPFAAGFIVSSANWNTLTGMAAATTSQNATLISPVRAIRINQTAGAGSVTLRVVQAGN